MVVRQPVGNVEKLKFKPFQNAQSTNVSGYNYSTCPCLAVPFCQFSAEALRSQFAMPQIEKRYRLVIPIFMFVRFPALLNTAATVCNTFMVFALQSTKAGQLVFTLQCSLLQCVLQCAACCVYKHSISSRCFQVLAVNNPQWH